MTCKYEWFKSTPTNRATMFFLLSGHLLSASFTTVWRGGKLTSDSQGYTHGDMLANCLKSKWKLLANSEISFHSKLCSNEAINILVSPMHINVPSPFIDCFPRLVEFTWGPLQGWPSHWLDQALGWMPLGWYVARCSYGYCSVLRERFQKIETSKGMEVGI